MPALARSRLRVRRAAAADDRRPGRDPRRRARPGLPSGRRVVHFQEYWVRLRAEVPAEALVFVGLEEAKPGPGVIDAITDADLVLVPPSNPVVSVGTILGVPRVREALRATTAPVVGLSPIVGGHHVRGMAEQLLRTIGVEVSAAAVGLHYGARSQGGVLDGWLVDQSDADAVDRVNAAGPGLRRRAADDDRPRRDGRDGGGGRRPGRMTGRAPRAPADRAGARRRPEVTAGDDLAAMVADLFDLEDGDVVAVTSKVVCQGRGPGPRGRPRGSAGRRDRQGGRPSRPHRHRAHPPRPDPGRGRRGRLQRRDRPRRAAARRTRTPRRGRSGGG